METTTQRVIGSETAEFIRSKYQAFHNWLDSTGKRSYKREEIPEGVPIVTNEEIAALEVYDFVTSPPVDYFLYVKKLSTFTGQATTWTGELLGIVQFGIPFRSNFGDRRIPVTIRAINGKVYYGTYYTDAGDYARVKMSKRFTCPSLHIGVANAP